VQGSGTYSLMGLSNSTFPTNSAVYPQALGASRNSPTTAPAHDAVGAGTFATTSGTSFSWSHTLSASATAILIEFTATQTVSGVTVGGTAASFLGSRLIAGSENAYM